MKPNSFNRQPKKILFTKEGYQKIKKKFQNLTEMRKEAVNRLQTAREMGDLSENGAYKAARFELSSIDRELRRLTFQLRFGQVCEPTNNGRVDFGCRVTLDDGKKRLTFSLVGGFESDPLQQKISINSPIGRAIMGKRMGDKVKVTAPVGQTTYTVVEIK
ncbi:transcription elongation factor GreA [Candidatus Woesebacteria bacterium]|nr:transcription elongation factor GreA [Candidatus Woesebacteria bacterium]